MSSWRTFMTVSFTMAEILELPGVRETVVEAAWGQMEDRTEGKWPEEALEEVFVGKEAVDINFVCAKEG